MHFNRFTLFRSIHFWAFNQVNNFSICGNSSVVGIFSSVSIWCIDNAMKIRQNVFSSLLLAHSVSPSNSLSYADNNVLSCAHFYFFCEQTLLECHESDIICACQSYSPFNICIWSTSSKYVWHFSYIPSFILGLLRLSLLTSFQIIFFSAYFSAVVRLTCLLLLNFSTKCNILNLRQIHMFHSHFNEIKRCKRRRKEKSKQIEISLGLNACLNFEEAPFIDMPLDLFYYVNLQRVCALESILIFHFYLICVHSTVVTCKKKNRMEK